MFFIRKIILLIILVGIGFSVFHCADEIADLPDDKFYDDDDNNGKADSLEKYAPDCKLGLIKCVEQAKEQKQVLIDRYNLLAANTVYTSHPDSITYDTVISITLSPSKSGAKIYYSFLDSLWDDSDSLYEQPLTLRKSDTLYAILIYEGDTASLSTPFIYNILFNDRISAPSFSRQSGSDTTSFKVWVKATDPESKVRCSTNEYIGSETDGFEPKDSIEINRNTSLLCKAFKSGYQPSERQASYTLIVPVPSFTNPPSTYKDTVLVSLKGIPGAKIYYQLGSGNFTLSDSNEYKGPFTIKSRTDIKVLATLEGWNASSLYTGTYLITKDGVTASPIFNLRSGIYINDTTLVIEPGEPGAITYWNRGNSIPDINDPLQRYTGSLPLSGTTNITAVSISPTKATSDPVPGVYTFVVDTPTVIMDKSVSNSVRVYIDGKTNFAEYWYTLNGTDIPTPKGPNSFLYNSSSPLEITQTTTLKIRGFKEFYNPSAVKSVEINKAGQLLRPVFVTKDSIFNAGTSITLTASAGATIKYTVDGSDPKTSGITYTSAGIQISKNTTIKAYALHNDSTPSEIETKNFYVRTPLPTFQTSNTLPLLDSVKVILSQIPANTRVWYTKNNPNLDTLKGTPYDPQKGIVLSESAQIRIIAKKDSFYVSTVSSPKEYKVKLDTAILGNGLSIDTIYKPNEVNLKFSHKIPGVSIYYTTTSNSTTGSIPDTNSNKYIDEIPLDTSLLITVRAFKKGSEPSDHKTYQFKVKSLPPTIAPLGSKRFTPFVTTLTAAPGDQIYFTLDGTDPYVYGKNHTTTLQLPSNNLFQPQEITVRAIVKHQGRMTSKETNVTYTYQPNFKKYSNLQLTLSSSPTLPQSLEKPAIDNMVVNFSSEDEEILKIENGRITPIGPGKTVVYAFAKDSSFWGSFEVEVLSDAIKQFQTSYDIRILSESLKNPGTQAKYVVPINLTNEATKSPFEVRFFKWENGKSQEVPSSRDDEPNPNSKTNTHTYWVNLDSSDLSNDDLLIKAYQVSTAQYPPINPSVFTLGTFNYDLVYHMGQIKQNQSGNFAFNNYAGTTADFELNIFDDEYNVGNLQYAFKIDNSQITAIPSNYVTMNTYSVMVLFKGGIKGTILYVKGTNRDDPFECTLDNGYISCGTRYAIRSKRYQNPSQWSQLVISATQKEYTVYLNGVEIGSTIERNENYPQTLRVGQLNDGFVDEVQFFKSSLIDKEVRFLFQSMVGQNNFSILKGTGSN